jgi:hypothetical protein
MAIRLDLLRLMTKVNFMKGQIDYLIKFLKYEQQSKWSIQNGLYSKCPYVRAAARKTFLNNDKPVYPIRLNGQFDVKIVSSTHA